jgi:hypothetical protein
MVALFAAATDTRRIGAVASVVPPVSGWSARELFPPDELAVALTCPMVDAQCVFHSCVKIEYSSESRHASLVRT